MSKKSARAEVFLSNPSSPKSDPANTFIMKKTATQILLLIVLCSAAFGGARSEVAETLLHALYKGGDETVTYLNDVTRAADLRMIDEALVKYGPDAGKAFEEGGYALLSAVRMHGNEVVEAAVRVPEATHYLATKSGEAMRIIHKFGDDGLRVEVTTPGLLTKKTGLLGKKEIARLAQLPKEQQKTLGWHLMHVSDSVTATRLIQAHEAHGADLLKKIPKKYLFGGGIITLLMVDTAVNEMAGEEGSRILQFLKGALLDLGWDLLPIVSGILGAIWLVKWAVYKIIFEPIRVRSDSSKNPKGRDHT